MRPSEAAVIRAMYFLNLTRAFEPHTGNNFAGPKSPTVKSDEW